MSPKNTSEHEGGGFAGDALETSVVITKNYKRLWFSLRVAVFITLKRSSPSDAPPVQTPTSQRLSRSSSRAEHKIDVPFDCEEKEEEVDRNGDNAINEQQLLLNTVDETYTRQGRLLRSFSEAEVETSIDLSFDAEDDTGGPTNEKVNCNGDGAVNQQQNLRNSVDQIVKEKNLNALTDIGGTEKVISIFRSHLETGLTQNASSDPKTWSTTNPVQAKDLFHFFLKECYSCTNFLLTVSPGLSLATEILQEGPKYGWQDGAIILMAVFLLVTFPSVGKFLRARKLEKQMLMRQNKLRVEVIRNGESRNVPISNIVQGDIVCLKEGDRVPGDGLYVHGDGLEVDEVLDSSIDRHHNPFLLYGSKVIEGNGRMIVTSDGTNSSIGKLMSMVNDVSNHKPNLLQTRIEQPNEYADKIALCMSILITVVMFLRFRNHHDNKELPELKGKVRVKEVMMIFERALLKPRGLVCILTTYLTAMVLEFQHGVSLIINFSLSHWNEKVASDNAKPQNLSACGTMGFITVICINVSSGLTCSQMEVGKFLVGNEETNNNHGEDCETSQIVLEALQRGIGISDLLPENLRSPTDDLLNSWVQSKWGQSMDLSTEPIKWSFNKKGDGVLIRKNGDEDVETIMHLHWKGSAKTILRMCSHYYDSEGNIHALEDQKSKFEQEIRDMEDDGLRPIAFAYKRMEEQEIREDGLILLALVGFKYKIGEDDKSAVKALRNAGVSIKLVSQDELQKAIEIAFELGICSRGSNDVVALEGKEFRNLNANARMEKIDQITVTGRFLPEDEVLMVQSLKQKGHAVTFYGGSTAADTLAIREADVGIVEATLSTEMAREGSDIIFSPG
ncbi:hypothetical protein F0562_008196 [Nyssa sinensis]|uniref:P-type ATPase A domain-containing protein n=1 Tax=Nyssa sinensis TaxID=561372 RepID=A0A5J5AB91_9ASTE|nr:hypothetical protein F0562_008196 [Nyssa sinensis]